MGKNRIKISIFGTDYFVTSQEEENYVRAIGDAVEKRITETMEENGRVSVLMAAVLAALDYCDEAKKAMVSADNLRSQIKDYLEDSSRARMEADEARREIERMKKEIQTLRQRLAEHDETPKAAAKTVQQSGTLPGRVIAPPAPISRPVPSQSNPVPPQARLYQKPEPISDKAGEDVMHFFDKKTKEEPKL